MLTRLYVDNFRCLVNLELALKQVSLFLGENGSGKSAAFDVIRRLRDFVTGECTSVEAFPTDTLTGWDTRNVQTFEMQISKDNTTYSYHLEVEHDRQRSRNRIKSETLKFGDINLYTSDGTNARLFRDDGSQGPEVLCDWVRSGIGIIGERHDKRHDNRLLIWFKDFVAKFIVARIIPSAMSSVSESEVSDPGEDFSAFVSWIRRGSVEQQAEHQEFVTYLRDELIDGFREFKFKSISDTSKELSISFNVAASQSGAPRKYEVRFSDLSDGQRVLIALYALLYYCQPGTTLCLDEPENYLALPEIQPWLLRLEADATEGKFQTLLISHHPEIMNLLATQSGYWFEREGAALTRVKPVALESGSGLSISELVARGWLHE
ncbi:MAG: AAA family ATPase [Planctomycetia bacterium]|nr:AAA family ATPase [Planctomycetia bacterium]